MILNNVLVFQGDYSEIKLIRNELQTFLKNKKQSKFYHEKTTKFIKKLSVVDESERNYLYELRIFFRYSKNNLKELIKQFQISNVTIAHMAWNEKKNIWIVNQYENILEFKLIPSYAINQIILDYMHYKESSIVLDSFETIKYDQNNNTIVVNEKILSDDELLDLLFNKTIKGKPFYQILESFIHNFHEKCINSYEDIYSINKESISSEEPSPLALFIVTFGIIAILFLLIKVMGYF